MGEPALADGNRAHGRFYSGGPEHATSKEKPPAEAGGFWGKTLTMTYSHMLDAHYHRRVRVSLPSSEWDRVVPRSYYHQGEGGGSRTDGLASS